MPDPILSSVGDVLVAPQAPEDVVREGAKLILGRCKIPALVGQPALVVKVGGEAGKKVGICLKDAFLTGHDCDGLLPVKQSRDEAGNLIGHGRWVNPGDLLTSEQWGAYLAEARTIAGERSRAKALVEAFLSE
jgi:hypothetical protein